MVHPRREALAEAVVLEAGRAAQLTQALAAMAALEAAVDEGAVRAADTDALLARLDLVERQLAFYMRRAAESRGGGHGQGGAKGDHAGDVAALQQALVDAQAARLTYEQRAKVRARRGNVWWVGVSGHVVLGGREVGGWGFLF